MWLGKVPAEKWMRMLFIVIITMLCVAGFHVAGWTAMCGVWMDGDVLPVSCLADCGGFVWRRDRSDELAV